jgi:hypothetical protein
MTTATALRPTTPAMSAAPLPKRTPGASNPPKPSAQVFAPIVFHTADAGALTAEVPVADWQAADFEVYESFASTARRIPTPVLAAAMSRLLEATPYLEADSEFNYVIGYDLDRQFRAEVTAERAMAGAL